ncbi:TPA: peptidoglycan DD-metalloendopeptidase family protein, partial [Aeromonas veronii]
YAQSKEQKINNSQSRLAWHWPAKGRIVEGFSVAEQGNKGIDIAGQKGQPVYAASSGKVVYAGSALRGYGKLIILKHDDDYLSAYAHNDELRVKEGDSVKGGSVIANMGSTDAPDVRLHFEIRYRGKSINPMSYLPKR